MHAHSWHQTYAGLVSDGFLARSSAEQRAERWRQIIQTTGGFAQYVVEVDSEMVGFAATGPGRDDDSPHQLELYSIYLLAAHHGSGADQELLDAAPGDRDAFPWVAAENARAGVLPAQPIRPRRRHQDG